MLKIFRSLKEKNFLKDTVCNLIFYLWEEFIKYRTKDILVFCYDLLISPKTYLYSQTKKINKDIYFTTL